MCLGIRDCLAATRESPAASFVAERKIDDLRTVVHGISHSLSPGVVLEIIILVLKNAQRKNLCFWREPHHARVVSSAMAMASNQARHAGAMSGHILLGISPSGEVFPLEDLTSQIRVTAIDT
ncbi:hypothetical protein AQI70_36600 [Streptomyces curacoi]|uniref:Uncharacterized protein n=1 Tax=Streptomyces curacoi TaxID=146536 RepID=A0A117NTI8_9ACTN|nr:hypothetical protein AQI70_36600 [Streptomyces curacoi]